MPATTPDPAERQTRSARRHRAAAAAFIAAYVVGWAWLVGFTDPSRWQALLAGGFAVLFALILVHEIVATTRSLRAANGSPASGAVGAAPDAAEATPAGRVPHD